MDDVTFIGRFSMASIETTYRLTAQALEWTSAKGEGRLALAEIAKVRVFDMPRVSLPLMGGGQLTPGFQQCVVQALGGRKLSLVSAHYQGVGAFEDRTSTFEPFVEALIARTAQANPQARFFQGAPGPVWGVWLGALLVCLAGVAFGMAVIVEGFRMGALSHWGEILGGLAFTGLCGFNLRATWRMVRGARSRRVSPQAPV